MRLLPYYFDAIEQAYTRAERIIGGSTDAYYKLGAKTLRLRFLGQGLIPAITAAINHLSAPPTEHPDLDICLWDDTIGPSAAPPPLTWLGNAPLYGYLNDGLIDLNSEYFPYRISAFDRERNLAYYWIEDPKKMVWWESAAPLRMILSWWASRHQLQVLHAGAVGTPEGGVLLGGKGGSGKSWTALSCLGSKLFFAADDYCLTDSSAMPTAYSLYSTAKLEKSEDLANFPKLLPLVSNPNRLENEKVVLQLYPQCKNEMILSIPLKAIFLVQVSSENGVRIEPANKHSAIREIFQSTAQQRTGIEPSDFISFYKFASRLPCYVLKVGKDRQKNVVAIHDFLSNGLR